VPSEAPWGCLSRNPSKSSNAPREWQGQRNSVYPCGIAYRGALEIIRLWVIHGIRGLFTKRVYINTMACILVAIQTTPKLTRGVAGTERTIATVAGRYGGAPPSAPPNGDAVGGGGGCRGARGATFHAASAKRDHCAGAYATLSLSHGKGFSPVRRATWRIGRTTGSRPQP